MNRRSLLFLLVGLALPSLAWANQPHEWYPKPSTEKMPTHLTLRLGEKRSYIGYAGVQKEVGAGGKPNDVVEMSASGSELRLKAVKKGSASYTLFRGKKGEGRQKSTLEKSRVTIEVKD